MDLDEVAARIEDGIPEADAEVRPARGAHDEDHLAARVVSPAFEGESLIDRHQLVYDALEDVMTDEIHALEVETYTREEWAEAE